MTRHLFAAPFAGFTILSPKRPYVPTMVQVRKPSVWHASPLNKTLTADPASVPTRQKSGGFHQHEPLGKRSSPPCGGSPRTTCGHKARSAKKTPLDDVFAPEDFKPFGGYSVHPVEYAGERASDGTRRVGIVAKVDGKKHAVAIARCVGKAPQRRFERMAHVAT